MYVVRNSIPRFLLSLTLALTLGIGSTFAAVIVDNSPDTTGVVTFQSSFVNQLEFQHCADRFTLDQDTTITGGAIFSNAGFAAVSDPVRFLIYPDESGSPGAVPVINVATVLDEVDGTLTGSDPSMSRKHASINPQLLPAGDYWFGIAGESGTEITQGTGVYDDNAFNFGTDANVDLELGVASSQGDLFFTVDGEPVDDVPVPTLNNWTLLLFLALVMFLGGLRALRRS